MFEKIKGIKIQSGIFENETILELFDGKFDGTNQTQNDRASLIFGRNGSGKSTIARGIQQLAIDGQEQDKLSFIDEHNDEITLGEMNKSSIFVFNEDYIEQKVKIAQDGLDTIVILGEQVDIDSQIDTLKESLSESQIEFQKYESELGEYKDDNNEKSPNYWKKKIASSLKGLGNWAERDREIKGNRAASPIHNDTFHKFVSLKPSLEKNDLEKEFQEKKERYFSLRDFAIPIKQNLEILDINFDRNAVADLLSKRIENPKLNPRDQHLLELLSDTMRGEPHLRQAKDFFSDEQNKICPFCTQPVSDSVKSELIDGITKLLSREVEEHQAALVKSKFCKLEKDLSNYKQLDSCLIRSYQDSLTTINSKLEAVNSVIDEKINNPYVVCKLPDIDISEDLAKLKSDTEKINQAIAAHNLEISDIENLKLSLLKMNNELAYYEIQSDYKKFQEKI
ncbi:TPA: AAA family ATPase, partial [Streptococcus suis]